MKKYFITFKNSIQTNLAYRFNTLASFFSESITLVILLYLWASIYRQGGQIGTYSLAGLLTYFILSRFVALITLYDDTAKKMNEEIAEGGAINYFLKPINYLHNEFAYKLGTVSYRLALYSLISALILIFAQLISLGRLYSGLPAVFYFLALLFIGITVNFLIFFIVGLLSFFLDYINGLNFMMFNLISLFSGNIIPLDLFPPYLASVSGFLPFKYLVFVPISVATGKIPLEEAPILLFSGILWVLGLYLGARAMLFFSFKKYEAYGG